MTALSGEEALAHMARKKPSVVLLDIMLPGMDGLSILRKIRRHDKTLPVFMLTAYANEQRFLSAQKLQASGFIVKTGDLGREVENITKVMRVSRRYRPDAR